MSVDRIVRRFGQFLEASWFAMESMPAENALKEDLVNDWMQTNWEILVESIILQGSSGFLEVYGDGAECNGDSSRVAFPRSLPTHRIACLPTSGSLVKNQVTGEYLDPEPLEFWGFVNWDGKKYSLRPSFNALLLEGDELTIVDKAEVTFSLKTV